LGWIVAQKQMVNSGSAPSEVIVAAIWKPIPPKQEVRTAQVGRVTTIKESGEAMPKSPDSFAITVPASAANPRSARERQVRVLATTEWDDGPLSKACVQSNPIQRNLLVGGAQLILLTTVDQLGQPVEIRVVQSSGDANRDTAVAGCVMTHGRFSPQQANERTSPLWQRVTWEHRSPVS
jgi:outer membrane biosynthesis protein TonB